MAEKCPALSGTAMSSALRVYVRGRVSCASVREPGVNKAAYKLQQQSGSGQVSACVLFIAYFPPLPADLGQSINILQRKNERVHL